MFKNERYDMDEGYKYVTISKDVIEKLKTAKFSISDLKEVTGYDTESLLILVDDGPVTNKHQTFGFYVLDWNHSRELVDKLRAVKKDHNIEGRTIAYKKRKDGMKRKAMKDWFSKIKNYHGMLYVLAFDNSGKKTPQYQKEYDEVKKSLEKNGIEIKLEIYTKMVCMMSIFVLLAPFLREGLKIAWVTDPDSIIDTPERKEILNNSVAFLLDELLGFKLGAVSCFTKFNDSEGDGVEMNAAFEELLSIPDMAASAFSAMLEHSPDNGEMLTPDDETSEIIEEMVQFQNVHRTDEADTNGLLGVSCFKLRKLDDNKGYRYDYVPLLFSKTKE